MAVRNTASGPGGQPKASGARGPGQSGGMLLELVDRILNKGIVIDVWARVSVLSIEALTVEARVVVASVETYQKYAETMAQTALASRPASASSATVVEAAPAQAQTQAQQAQQSASQPQVGPQAQAVVGALSQPQAQPLVIPEDQQPQPDLQPAPRQPAHPTPANSTQHAAPSAPAPIPSGNVDLTTQLQQLAQLRQTGALSDAEFQAAKATLLNPQQVQPAQPPQSQQTPQDQQPEPQAPAVLPPAPQAPEQQSSQ